MKLKSHFILLKSHYPNKLVTLREFFLWRFYLSLKNFGNQKKITIFQDLKIRREHSFLRWEFFFSSSPPRRPTSKMLEIVFSFFCIRKLDKRMTKISSYRNSFFCWNKFGRFAFNNFWNYQKAFLEIFLVLSTKVSILISSWIVLDPHKTNHRHLSFPWESFFVFFFLCLIV